MAITAPFPQPPANRLAGDNMDDHPLDLAILAALLGHLGLELGVDFVRPHHVVQQHHGRKLPACRLVQGERMVKIDGAGEFPCSPRRTTLRESFCIIM